MSQPDPTANSLNLPFVETLYQDYLADPQSVEEHWREYFDSIASLDDHQSFRTQFEASQRPIPGLSTADPTSLLQDRVDQIVRAHRVRGHLLARLDPLNLPKNSVPELELSFYGLKDSDLDRTVSTTTVAGIQTGTIREIVDRLRQTYCRYIGVQFMHIDDLPVKNWLQSRMEASQNRLSLSRDEQVRILTRLSDAVVFEQFIQRKYPGAKSFSLEGAETLVPLLAMAMEAAGEKEIEEVVIGMAHRGRLNVLANIMGKSPHEIFREFDDVDPGLYMGSGDVKYHLGHSADWKCVSGRQLHMSLCFNPSHLEFVNPVAMGRLRAKQDRVEDSRRSRGLCVLVHGDAAFIGEGVIQETLNLSEVPAYTVGGTLHVVVNNQIGFTTPAKEGRSSVYATDIAKMLQVPVFHVNGEDPEAVAQVVQLAMDFRETFQRDVVIDMYCYRRRGHNEGDEPAFTQPIMYQAIREREPVRKSYLNHLVKLGKISVDEGETIVESRRKQLDEHLKAAREQSEPKKEKFEWLRGVWDGYTGGPEPQEDIATRVDRDRLSELLMKSVEFPEGFRPHRKLERFFESRRDMALGEKPLSWSEGEALAFASLVTEGHPVRVTGQDSIRGTFSHRHAGVFDSETGDVFFPLQNLDADQARFEVYNSTLSENGVLGFEYGYSLDCPEGLVIWEAQFGDFCNVAQVIIDQFIVSAEDKWRRLSGLVLLLPHGFEGMGPEHSSARLERFLMLSAEHNIQIVNLTTPAQIFHCLRRQVLRPWRKPLVVMTPKSLLRHPSATSDMSDLSERDFQKIIPDEDHQGDHIQRVLLCSGKIYYDLLQAREECPHEKNVAIVRLEQLYPTPKTELLNVLSVYPEGIELIWVQEEPENMGAWRFIKHKIGDELGERFRFSGITRDESASPATGSPAAHQLEQSRILTEALTVTSKAPATTR